MLSFIGLGVSAGEGPYGLSRWLKGVDLRELFSSSGGLKMGRKGGRGGGGRKGRPKGSLSKAKFNDNGHTSSFPINSALNEY